MTQRPTDLVATLAIGVTLLTLACSDSSGPENFVVTFSGKVQAATFDDQRNIHECFHTLTVTANRNGAILVGIRWSLLPDDSAPISGEFGLLQLADVWGTVDIPEGTMSSDWVTFHDSPFVATYTFRYGRNGTLKSQHVTLDCR